MRKNAMVVILGDSLLIKREHLGSEWTELHVDDLRLEGVADMFAQIAVDNQEPLQVIEVSVLKENINKDEVQAKIDAGEDPGEIRVKIEPVIEEVSLYGDSALMLTPYFSYRADSHKLGGDVRALQLFLEKVYQGYDPEVAIDCFKQATINGDAMELYKGIRTRYGGHLDGLLFELMEARHKGEPSKLSARLEDLSMEFPEFRPTINLTKEKK